MFPLVARLYWRLAVSVLLGMNAASDSLYWSVVRLNIIYMIELY
jgi:hypothetical protein